MKINENVHLDIYENLVIIENSEITGVISKSSLTKLINFLEIEKIIELCDVVQPDFTVETNEPSQKDKED
jgi:hypothetical protein